MWKRMTVALVGGSLALALAAPAASAGDRSLEELAIGLAQTPEQHAVVAKHYRAQAAEARAAAAHHQEMGRTYGGGNLARRSRLQEHCRKIAEEYGRIAEQFDELAELHATKSE